MGCAVWEDSSIVFREAKQLPSVHVRDHSSNRRVPRLLSTRLVPTPIFVFGGAPIAHVDEAFPSMDIGVGRSSRILSTIRLHATVLDSN